MFFVAPLHDGVSGLGCDAAVVVAVAGHVNEAIIAPVCGPAVLNEPVVARADAAIAHGEHLVVKRVDVARAVRVEENARVIAAEVMSRSTVSKG